MGTMVVITCCFVTIPPHSNCGNGLKLGVHHMADALAVTTYYLLANLRQGGANWVMKRYMGDIKGRGF